MEKANNTLSANPKKVPFSAAIRTQAYQNLLSTAIKDEKRRNRLVTSVMAAVSANPDLQKCDARSILVSALQGEALDLSPSPALGEYWIVPYRVGKADYAHPENETYIAKFQLGVSGYIQLAMRSGQYKDLDSIEIKEGEFKGRDKETGKPIFEFIEDEAVRVSAPTIGYLAYFILMNGFKHSVYFSREYCIDWADRYSPAFDKELFSRYVEKKVTDWKELQKCSSPWYEHFSLMAQKTVLKQCLKRAPKSIEMREAEESEAETESEIELPILNEAVLSIESSEERTPTPSRPKKKTNISEAQKNEVETDG